MKKICSILLVLLVACTAFAFSASAADGVVFVSDGGTGDGSSAASAVDTLEKAYAKLPSGGTVVVCGTVTITSVQCPAHSGTMTVTSVYDGTDYRRSGAKLSFGDKDANSLALGGDTVFQDILLEVVNNRARTITCNGNDVVFSDTVECIRADSSYQWLGITLGSFGSDYAICDDSQAGSLTINGGSWQIIRFGNRGSDPKVVGDIHVTINGGTFAGNIIAATAASVEGNIDLTINGGTFKSADGTALSLTPGSSSQKAAISGDVNLTINGGVFSNVNITVTRSQGDGGVRGNATVNINGGKFTDYTMVGIGAYSGNAVLNLDASKFSDISFINKIGFTVNQTGELVTTAPVTTEAPVVTTEAPAVTTEVPVVTTVAPVTTEAPADTTAPASVPAESGANLGVIIGIAAAVVIAVAVVAVVLAKKKK